MLKAVRWKNWITTLYPCETAPLLYCRTYAVANLKSVRIKQKKLIFINCRVF